MNSVDILGREMYFVHKGTWDNDYEWSIEKVKVTAVKYVHKNRPLVEFSFSCVHYEYPLSYLKSTMKSAKTFAISEINKEKERQINSIKSIATQTLT